MIDYKQIEERWQRAWAEARIFESDANDKESYMVTAAFPYANAPQHIGHLRTFGTADTLARYKRMRGLNVLYPMAFHATGTPVLAFAKRIRENDEELIKELKMFHIPDEEIAKMTDPLYIANYFIKEIEKGMKQAGYSIDWRRKFISIDPIFSKFIEWQFGILNKKGYLIQGRHAVGWCPNENNAVGMHDTKHDVEPEIEKEAAIKFRVEGEDSYMLCTTYRPETVFGVTNLFVNESAPYVTCKIEEDESTYYVSKASSEALRYQMNIKILGEIPGKELLQKRCLNPVNNTVLLVLPGFFVKEDIGTGIVMSVPAHAPFDYAALERLKEKGYDLRGIKPIKILDVEVGKSLGDAEKSKAVHLDTPALAYLETLNANASSADELLELATELEYKEESHFGRMSVEGYKGMSEPEAREKIKSMLIQKRKALEIYVLTNESPVYCRCNYRVVVKVVENQWFLNYGNKEWKSKVKEVFKNLTVLPEKSRNAFDSAIDWIDLRAVTRAQGLGTRFPFDNNYIIESLSDSTIYMSFYTISNFIREIEPSKLKPEFFDSVLLGKGDPESVAKLTGIEYEMIRNSRESFDYWYNRTSRHSGPDLIFNHLTMYLYNHAAIFEKGRWPKQIVVNGSVLSEGEKMSKSLGNIVPLVDGLSKYGADPLRLVVIGGADLFSDSEFSDDAVNGVRERFEYLHALCSSLDKYDTGELKHIDYWLYSRLNRKIDGATRAIEKLELRDFSIHILYNSVLELKRYTARGGKNSLVLRDYLSSIVLMLQPLVPHISEELWHMLSNTTFASMERWPTADTSMLNEKAEAAEELVDKVVSDIKQVTELMRKKGGKAPTAIKIIVADDWKRELNNKLLEEREIGKVIEYAKGKKEINIEKASRYLTELAKKMNTLQRVDITHADEYKVYSEAISYMKGLLGLEIDIEEESKSRSQRATRALPVKPSIDLVI